MAAAPAHEDPPGTLHTFAPPSETSYRSRKWVDDLIPKLRNAGSIKNENNGGNGKVKRPEKVSKLVSLEIGQAEVKKDYHAMFAKKYAEQAAYFAFFTIEGELLQRIRLILTVTKEEAKYTLKSRPDPFDEWLPSVLLLINNKFPIDKNYLLKSFPALEATYEFYAELMDTDESMQGGKRRKQKRRSSKKHKTAKKSRRSKKSRKFSRKH